MNEAHQLFEHLEAYHTDRLAWLKGQREGIRAQAYSERDEKEFWQNKGKLHILQTLINIEESLVSHED